ncbi:MAG: DUF177 domain-containing protein [Bacteroidetes bacterium]|nr:DUF177 domain-containing protein [Bacteroidota bacterium]
MAILKQFNIPFVGLKNGVHVFDFEIDHRFFAQFEDSYIKEAQVSVKLNFDKKDLFFKLDFSIDGKVKVPCDRCLEEFDVEIFNDFAIFVKFEERESKIGDEDNVIYLSKNDSHVDVSQVVYDFILLSVPMQNIHPNGADGEPTCNPAVIKKLKGEDNKSDALDPRWEALKKLK